MKFIFPIILFLLGTGIRAYGQEENHEFTKSHTQVSSPDSLTKHLGDTATLHVSPLLIPANTGTFMPLEYEIAAPAYGQYDFLDAPALPTRTLKPKTIEEVVWAVRHSVLKFQQDQWNFKTSFWKGLVGGNRHFLSWMQGGLVPDAVIGGEPYFDTSIFLDKNFDQRVYNPGGIYNVRRRFDNETLTFPKSSTLPPIMR